MAKPGSGFMPNPSPAWEEWWRTTPLNPANRPNTTPTGQAKGRRQEAIGGLKARFKGVQPPQFTGSKSEFLEQLRDMAGGMYGSPLHMEPPKPPDRKSGLKKQLGRHARGRR